MYWSTACLAWAKVLSATCRMPCAGSDFPPTPDDAPLPDDSVGCFAMCFLLLVSCSALTQAQWAFSFGLERSVIVPSNASAVISIVSDRVGRKSPDLRGGLSVLTPAAAAWVAGSLSSFASGLSAPHVASSNSGEGRDGAG